MSEKKKKNRIEIILVKDGEADITVTCPEKIKLSFIAALMELHYGLPPMDVKPMDKKGLIKIIGLFFGMFIIAGIPTIGIPLALGLLIFNFIVTQNYYFDFLQSKLKDGYTPQSEETKQLLEKAGVLPLSEKNSKSMKKAGTIIGGVVLILIVFSLFGLSTDTDTIIDRCEDIMYNVLVIYDEVEQKGYTPEMQRKLAKEQDKFQILLSNIDEDSLLQYQKERLLRITYKLSNPEMPDDEIDGLVNLTLIANQ
jgi:hypothetical protein